MGLFGLSWYLWGIIFVVIAGVMGFISRREQGDLSMARFIVVRWFFTLVFVLLAITFFLLGTQNTMAIRLAYVSAIIGGLVYLIYFIATLRP